MDLCAELRAATDPIHMEVENLPLSQAMAAGTVSKDEYIPLLRLLLAAHAGWEAEVEHEPACAAIWTPTLARTGVLERDLRALGDDETEVTSHPAIDSWLGELRTLAAEYPETWLGVIYLFEGSRMGSMALLRPLAKALRVPPIPGHGLDYHADGIADRVPRWQRMKRTLDALPLSAEQRHAAVRGAVASFEMLRELYTANSLIAVG